MRKLKKILSLVLAITMVFGLITNPLSVQAAATTDYVYQLVSYFKNYQDAAATDIERVISEMKQVDEATADAWEDIMGFWSKVNKTDFVNVEAVPEGLPEDDSMAVVILGFKLKSDGTMEDELIGRLETGLAIAEKYENSYVVVTGGGTASNNPNVTEGDLMGAWLVENGLDESRLIIEDRAPDTVGNAKYTYDILKNSYTGVDSIVLVTSDYHVSRGCLLYYSTFVMDALAAGKEPLQIVANMGYDTTKNYESISAQASGLCSVVGINSSSLPAVTLSVLETITVTQEAPYVAGEELALKVQGNYDSGYVRDLTDLVKVTGFDPALGADQTVSISYTENDVTITGRFALSETEKTMNAYAGQLEKLVAAAAEAPSIYTEKSLETLQFAVENAEAVLADAASTDEDIFAAKEVLNKAMDALTERENIAYKKPATASANTANAYKLTDGNLGSYWETLENGNNIPINESHFVIDLQGIYDVDTIKAVPYFKGEERYYHYDISVSTDNVTWEKVAEQRSTEDTLEAGAVFTLEEAKEARYIRVDGVAVSVTGRDDINNFHVTEMMVYGDLVEEVEIEKAPKEATNLAVYSKVTANEGATSIDLLTDSKIENAYSNSNKGIADSYVVVELPGKALLESFRVVTYYNNTAKWYTWEVLVSDDNATWTSVGKYETESNPGKTGATITLEEPVTGKYVKFQGLNTNNTSLHLVEVEAYGTIDNIAEGKPTTVNKYSNNNGAAAVDGNKSSYWDSDTTWEEATEADYPCLIVDLEAVYELDRINVLNYRSTSRYYQYEIYTSVDGEEYTLFAEKKDEANSTFNRTFVADETTARYIKFVGTKNSANSGFHLNELTVTGTLVVEEAADYSAVEAALAKVPADFSVYTAASVVDLKIAAASVEEGLLESQQKRVDAMAQAIEDAVAALEYKPADYTLVEEVLVKVPADLSLYTEETANAVTDAVNAVVRDKNITEQSDVDAMAKAIEDAVAALTYKPADYTVVADALAKVPADLELYTDESVEALNEVLDAVDSDLTILEQDEVDSMAQLIEAAIEALVYKPADYSAVEEALATVPSDLTVYTEETANAVTEAVESVVRDKNISEQEEVDAMAAAIEDAVAALEYKEADYSAVEEALATVPEDLTVYTEETVSALLEAIDTVVGGLIITEQDVVDAMAVAIEDAVAALEYKAADYTVVEEALAKVPSDLTVYTEETAKAVTDAVEAVVRDKDITEQAEVDAMAKAIEDAVAALELLATQIDKAKLESLINGATTDKDAYTEDSWASFEAALEVARAVLADEDATQEEVDNARKALFNAALGLVKKPEPTPTETEVPQPTETEAPQPTETEAPLPESTVIGAQLLDGTKLTVVENGTEDFQWGGTYPVLEVTVPKGTEYVQLILPENVTVYDDAAFAKRNPEKIAVDPATIGGDFEFYLLFINNGTPYYFVKFVEAELPIPTVTEAPQPSVTEAPQPSVTEAPQPSVTEAPQPSVTEAPQPSVTEAPQPSVTEAPQPSVTEAPKPTETPEATEDVKTVFSDVHKDWYTEYVQYVYDNGLMTGIKGTTQFAPNANITKAQVAQVLYNMENQPEVADRSVFTDLKDVYKSEWYADAVAWAYSTGVVTGDLTTKKFNPNADVTREQLALMMFRYAQYKKYDTSATSDFAGLTNAHKVASWSKDGVKWAVGAGLISGVEKNGVKDLDPQGNASRAQMAAILQRFCENAK